MALRSFLIKGGLFLFIGCLESKLFPIEPRNSFQDRTKWSAGSVWPLPRFHHSTPDIVTFDPYSFRIVPMRNDRCEPLEFAVVKYSRHFLFPDMFKLPTPADPNHPVVSRVYVELSAAHNDCLSYPQLSENPEHEQYVLTVDSTINGLAEVKIRAETIWGALRGIETFSQLIWSNLDMNINNATNGTSDKQHYYMNSTTIYDWPRFPHRGLMIDSARHYLPERIFYQILDGLMHNKMNVLHWHITDDQSFPYVSTKFPELSEKGAYTPKSIYTPAMVRRILEAARLRGIRVILEFDTPGHTHAFGKAFPELLTPCYGGDGVTPGTPDHPYHAAYENLDPTKEFTYKFMKEFFNEIALNVTKDKFIHLGLDEIYMACWQSSPEIKNFMIKRNFTRVSQVQEYYAKKHIAMVKSLGLSPIVWQDPLDYGVKLDKDVIIQVWKDWGLSWQDHFQGVLDKGYRTILSAPWYLNYISYGEAWKAYYKADPIQSLPDITPDQEKQILGGEACIWGEYVDKTNILPRIFPFVGAIAERLWSKLDADVDLDQARGRLDQQRCRLLRRGIPAQPIFNGYCGSWAAENEYL